MNNFRIRTVVFCESIRQEIGGKHTLLGVVSPELYISKMPETIPVSMWLSGNAINPGKFAAEFRALDPVGDVLLKGGMDGEFAGTGESALAIGPIPLTISKGGDYSFEWRFGSGKWTKIGKLKLTPLPEGTVMPGNQGKA